MLLMACGGGGTTSTGGGAGSTSNTASSTGSASSSGSGGGASTSTATSSATGSASSSSSSSSSSGGGGGAPVGACGRRCAVDADCCPAGDPDCPGVYPHNPTCVDLDNNGEKTCRGVECGSDADCNPGAGTTYACKSLDKLIKACVLPCVPNGPCSAGTTCIGVADDSTMYCALPSTPFTCTPAGDECKGAGLCAPSGDKCVCTADTQCDDAQFRKDCVDVGQ